MLACLLVSLYVLSFSGLWVYVSAYMYGCFCVGVVIYVCMSFFICVVVRWSVCLFVCLCAHSWLCRVCLLARVFDCWCPCVFVFVCVFLRLSVSIINSVSFSKQATAWGRMLDSFRLKIVTTLVHKSLIALAHSRYILELKSRMVFLLHNY